MEPVSLSVSILALASLFDTALNCFEKVRVTKSFGVDSQTCFLRLQNLQLRLTRWGKAIGLNEEPLCGEDLTTTKLAKKEIKQAESLVNHIVLLFSEAEDLATKYRGKSQHQDAIGIDSDVLGDAGKLCRKMRTICLNRQRHTSITEMARWTVLDKKTLGELINHIQDLINDLVQLFPPDTIVSIERPLCEQEARELRDETALSRLQEVTQIQDAELAAAIARMLGNTGPRSTTFNNSGNTRIVNQSDTQNIYGGQSVSF